MTNDEAPGEGFWLTLSDLARARSVSRSSLSERVARLERLGHAVSRRGSGRTLWINVAAFDHAAGETTDAIRAMNSPRSRAEPRDPVLIREQARRVSYDADLKRIELNERLATVVRREEVEAAKTICRERLVSVIDGLSEEADFVAEAIARDGVIGARQALKTVAVNLRRRLAEAMIAIADKAETSEAT